GGVRAGAAAIRSPSRLDLPPNIFNSRPMSPSPRSRFPSPAHRLLLAAVSLVATSVASAGPDDGRTVLCFVSHKASHGYGQHEYAAGSRLIGAWLEAAYADADIECRYSVNWPEDPGTFFKDADTVVFFCSGGASHLVNGHVPEFDAVMRTGAGLACL